MAKVIQLLMQSPCSVKIAVALMSAFILGFFVCLFLISFREDSDIVRKVRK